MRNITYKVTLICSMHGTRHRPNYLGFSKKIIYQMSINKERMIITEDVHESLGKILSFLLFLS